jgi:CO/xanthine dehydrogenase Mo-binding subunit/CO/xanthine dehydrogenase FAD-binding subunit
VIIGERIRPLGWEGVTAGTARYVTDLDESDVGPMLHGAILRSPHPHARVVAIDVSAARAVPGVEAIVTPADFDGVLYGHLGAPFSDRPILAGDVVRHVGQEVAAVAATSREVAARAVELIEVTYEVLPAVTTPAQALARGAPQVHAGVEGNVAMALTRRYGDPEAALRASDTTVSATYRYPSTTHLCMEPHGVVARWDSSRRALDLWPSTHSPYFVRKEVAAALGLEMEQVHTHEVAVGGSFGAKAKVGEHEVVAAALSMRTGRAVRIVLDRGEEFATTHRRHAFDIELTTGATAEGRVVYRRCHTTVDNGSFNHSGPSVAGYGCIVAGSLYDIVGAEAGTRLVHTNTQPGGSFRGYGNAQVTFAMESQLDELAEAMGLDPIDMRITSAHHPGDETLTGWRLGSARLVECLEAVRDGIDWDAGRALGGSGRGVGVAAAVHVSGARAYPGSEYSGAAIDVDEEGGVRVRFAGADPGTGQSTLLAQIAAAGLGVDRDAVEVVMMESDGTPPDQGGWSSRGTVWGGNAVVDAAGKAAARLRELAALKLGVDPDAVFLADGRASGGGADIDIGDLVRADETSTGGELHFEGGYLADVETMNRETGTGHFSPSYSFAAHAVEVEIDRDTGEVHVSRVVAAHDSGTAINRAAVEGQIVGGVAMGLGAALSEEMVHTGGRLVTASYLDYATPRSADLPTITPILVEDPDPVGPHGAKGIGEIVLIPTPPAVANAVAHACGVRVRDLPLTPDKILPHLAEPTPVGALWRRPRRWWVEGVRRAYPRGLHRVLHRWGTRWSRRVPERDIDGLIEAGTVDDAIAAHDGSGSAGSESAYIAGGTDLLVARRQGLVQPVTLVDLESIPELTAFVTDGDRDMVVGAMVRLASLGDAIGSAATGTHPAPGDRVLVEALERLATPQIREMATVGGNLLQGNRCPYLRNGFDCYKRGGPTCPCYALEGEHRFHHAVMGAHRCQAVTPSDLATALLVLDARVEVAGADGRRREVDVEALYTGPGETILEGADVLTSVRVPVTARRRWGAFEKLDLFTGGFAVASVAVSLGIREGVITDARIGLGGVAPTPVRSRRSETALLGSSVDDVAALERAATAWAVDAHPLRDNRWKVDATVGLLRRALRTAGQPRDRTR